MRRCVFFGGYLLGHPGFADEGHWRVNVEDKTGRGLPDVIVTTVTSREARRAMAPALIKAQ